MGRSKGVRFCSVEIGKVIVAMTLLLGVLGSAIEVSSTSVAGAAFTASLRHGFATWDKYPTATATPNTAKKTILPPAATFAPTDFDINTLVTGGKANFDPASVKLLTATSTNGGAGAFSLSAVTATKVYAILTPKKGNTAAVSAKLVFGLCIAGKAAYTAASGTCTKDQITYKAPTHLYLGNHTTTKFGGFAGTQTYDDSFTQTVAVTIPATVPQNTTFTMVIAYAPYHFKTKTGTGTLKYDHDQTIIMQMAAAATFKITGALKLIGGTKLTNPTIMLAKYCAAAATQNVGTECTGTLATGNYKTTDPYMEMHIKTSDHTITGPNNFTFPTLIAKFKAVGAIGKKNTLNVNQVRWHWYLTAPATTKGTIHDHGYPTTKIGVHEKTTKTDPPYAAPPILQTTTITAHVPQVTSTTLSTGITTGGYTDKVIGKYFETDCTGTPVCGTKGTLEVTSVTYAGLTATVTAVLSTTSIKIKDVPAYYPAAVPAPVTVAVKTKTGVVGTKNAAGTVNRAFTYEAGPAKTIVITPKTGPATGTTAITITGKNLYTLSTITFGTVAGTVVSHTSGTKVVVKDPKHAPGKVSIKFKTAGSATVTETGAFTYTYAVPTVTTLAPTSGPTTGATPVTIKGTNFRTKETGTLLVTTVTFGGSKAVVTPATTTTTLVVKTTKHKKALVTVEVTTKGGGPLTSATKYTYGYPVPKITSFTPTSGPTTGATPVTIKGSHFETKGNATAKFPAKVKFGATTATAVNITSTTTLIATAPAHIQGTVILTLHTTGGTVTSATVTSGPKDYTYTYPVETVGTLSPSTGLSSGGTPVTIKGTNFRTKVTGTLLVTTVTFGGSKATVTAASTTTTLVVKTTKHKKTVVTVKVTTKGGGPLTSATKFSYLVPPATVIGVTPSSGPTTGTQIATVDGTNFETPADTVPVVTAVTFAGTILATFTVASGTTISVTTPPHALGTVSVSVTTTATAVKKSTAYKYVAASIGVSRITPKVGTTTGGTPVTIFGTHFVTSVSGKPLVTAVDFGTTAAATFTVKSATLILAKTKPHVAASVSVTVHSTTGTPVAPTKFTFQYPLPTATTVGTMPSGPTTGKTTTTIHGTHFKTKGNATASIVTYVTIGGTHGTTVKVTSTTTLTVLTPAHAVGAATVVVATKGGSATDAETFSYTYPVPTVTTLVPASGTTAGTTPVTIKGTHFVTKATGALLVTTVTFGGSKATVTASKTTTTTLVVVTTEHKKTLVTVKVTTLGGGPLTSATKFTYAYPVTTVGTMSPTTGPTTGSTVVTIKGTHFLTKATGALLVTTVTFGGSKATLTASKTTTTTLVVVNAYHTAGKVTVKVTTIRSTVLSTTSFTYISEPISITSISPSTGATTAETTITITGTRFKTGKTHATLVTYVTFSGARAVALSVTSSTQLVAKAPQHVRGAVTVTVHWKTLGTKTAGMKFTFVTPAPTISAVLPTSGVTTGSSVTLRGTYLWTTVTESVRVTKVLFGGVAGTNITVQSVTTMKVNAPKHAAGLVVVSASDVGGTGTAPTSYLYKTPPPTLTSVTSPNGPTTGTTTVALHGHHFVTQATTSVMVTSVEFGTTNAVSFNVTSTTVITAVTPPNAPGPVAVKVHSKGGTSATLTYTYLTPSPIVTSVTTDSGPTTGTTSVTIHGSHFVTKETTTVRVSTVSFGASSVAVTKTDVTATAITLSTPLHVRGTVSVSATIATIYGGGAGTAGTAFSYVTPKPQVTTISAVSGLTTGGLQVTLRGSHFETKATASLKVTKVDFGGISGASVHVTGTGDVLFVTTPPHASGPVTVAASINSVGTGSLATAFTFETPQPVVTSVTKSTGLTTGSAVVTIYGSNFVTSVTATVKVSQVTFTSTAATLNTAVVTATAITGVKTPKHTKGTVSLSATIVTTFGGGTGTETHAYTYVLPKPQVTGVTPSVGTTTGNLPIQINGSHFTGATVVSLGGSDAVITNVTSAGQISAITAPHAPGLVTASVTTPGGTGTPLPNAYSYVTPAPTVSGVTPSVGPTTGKTPVIVRGTHFETKGTTTAAIVSAVTFGTSSATTVAVASSSELTAKTPSHSAGAVGVSVATSSGAGSKPTAFTYVTSALVPGSPKDVAATAGDGQVTLTWVVPADNDSPIVSFIITPKKNGVAQTPIVLTISALGKRSTVEGVTDKRTIKGLTNSDTYTFEVSATNAVGTSIPGLSNSAVPHSGFWLATAKGGVANFGNAKYYGSEIGLHLNKPIEGITATSNDKGYWMVATDGGIFTFGNASFYGSMGDKHLKRPIKALAVTPTGKGYWLVEENGQVFHFGKAKAYGTLSKKVLFGNVIAITSTNDGKGYWLVTTLGIVHPFGDAKSYGTVIKSKKHATGPIVGFAATKDNKGYWLVTAIGKVYHFGDAKTYGQGTAKHPKSYITGIETSADGNGYWIAETNGTILSFGDAERFKATSKLKGPAVAMAPMH